MDLHVQKMQSRNDLEKIRIRLWDRFITNRAVHGETTSFDDFWYEFLVRYSISESPADAYDDICRDLEK